jgi:hypothetical protein
MSSENKCPCKDAIYNATHIVCVDSGYYPGIMESMMDIMENYPNKQYHFCGHIYSNEPQSARVDVEKESITTINKVGDNVEDITYYVKGNSGSYKH